MNPSREAEAIQQRMEQVRRELDDDVGEIYRSAQTRTDWRFYVMKYPWPSLAAAMALGYFLVPRRSPLGRRDAHALADLAKQHRLTVADPAPHQPPGAIRTALRTASTALVRNAAAFAAAQLVHLIGARYGWTGAEHPQNGQAR